jgi:hypothetical protein
VALSLGSPPPVVSRHRVPVEPGLSSIGGFAPPIAAVRLPGAQDVRHGHRPVKLGSLGGSWAARSLSITGIFRGAAPPLILAVLTSCCLADRFARGHEWHDQPLSDPSPNWFVYGSGAF